MTPDAITLPEKSELGFNEFVETLTGHEEAAIEQRFGLDPYSLLETQEVKASRAFVYVHQRRYLDRLEVKGSDAKAYAYAMDLSLKAVSGFWADEIDEPDPEQPVTPVGEGVSADVS